MSIPPPPVADAGRCPRCFLPERFCICAAIPRLEVSTRVVIVRHRVERHRGTNTGRLVYLALAGSRLLDHGVEGHPLQAADLPGPGAWLLHPEPPARPQPEPPPQGPGTLLVLDGTWNQVRRMARRLPGVGRLPRITLTTPAPNRPRIRRPPFPEARSTLEAVAEALVPWEGEATRDALLELYDRLVRGQSEARHGCSAIGGSVAPPQGAR